MGFSFRKTFRLGPARLSVSKSGPSLSGGVKGARVGIGTRGAYVAAAMKGITYRKYLGAPGAATGSDSELSPAAVIVVWLVMLSIVAAALAVVAVVVWAITQ